MAQRTESPATIVEALAGIEECTSSGVRFISRTGEATFYPYCDIMKRARRVAGSLQSRGLVPGDRVGIILPTSIHFFDVFLGVMLAGGIPSALYPPFRLGRLAEYYDRTRGMLSKIGARFLVVDGRTGTILGPVVEGVDTIETVLNPPGLLGSDDWTPVHTDPHSPAFLQFSSGTTVDPKAVIVSHANLVSNLAMMGHIFRSYSPEELSLETVCWLPLYHDMGLVGCMFNGLYLPATINYIEPDVFIARPALWLQTISRYRAAISPAPHFAYGLCTKKIRDDDMTGVDLSCWKVAMNGSEQIDVEGMRAFERRFKQWGFTQSAMTPVYGLAETVLAVTFSDFMEPPVVKEFDRTAISEKGKAEPGTGYETVSVGRPLSGIDLRICDEHDRSIDDNHVGRIMVRGPSVSPGYYGDPESTNASIRNGWLDTGDLGFICDNDLFITGRTKDIIIIRGQNIAPQALETLVSDLPDIRTGCVAAVSRFVRGQGEQLIILAERDRYATRSDESLERTVREHIITATGLNPHIVRILAPGTLPRTSSGKLRRSDALTLFLAGQLEPPVKMGILKTVMQLARSGLAWGRFRLKRFRRHGNGENI